MPRVPSWFRARFPEAKPILGVVHLLPLPGAPGGRRVDVVLRHALADTDRYLAGGVDGLVVENFGDAPFRKGAVEPHTVAVMTRVAAAMRERAPRAVIGVNVLRNDACSALGIAAAVGLDFVRVNVLSGVVVTDQGLIEGDAATVVRYRDSIAGGVRIFADLRVKHAAPLRSVPVEVEVDELVSRARADAVLVTGDSTGHPPSASALAEVRRAARATPVVVASGVDVDNLGELAPHADAFVVGTSMKVGGRTTAAVDPRRVRALVRARDAARGG